MLHLRAFNEVLEGMKSQAEENSLDILAKLVNPKAELYPGIQSVLHKSLNPTSLQ